LGRRLERALCDSQMMRGMLAAGGAREPEALEALLEILDSVMTYRSRYTARFQLAAVLDLLIADETNPRSIAFQLMECAAHVDSLETDKQGSDPSTSRHSAKTVLNKVRGLDIVRVARDFDAGRSVSLFEFFETIDSTLPMLSDAISHRFFFHSGAFQRLSDLDSLSAIE
jgi:uncharacterized alpha-E superfamily protein